MSKILLFLLYISPSPSLRQLGGGRTCALYPNCAIAQLPSAIKQLFTFFIITDEITDEREGKVIPEGDDSIADWPADDKGCGRVQGHLGDIGDTVGEPDVRQGDLQHGGVKSTESEL